MISGSADLFEIGENGDFLPTGEKKSSFIFCYSISIIVRMLLALKGAPFVQLSYKCTPTKFLIVLPLETKEGPNVE